MSFTVHKDGEFEYIEEGEGEVLLLLHGLFGALSNWDTVINKFSKTHRVLIPVLPIYTMPIRKAGVNGIVDFTERFVAHMGLDAFHIIGNSLGGHVGIVYTLRHQERVKSLVLTGSSGLYENAMGSSFPRRSNYDFVQEKVGYTFYDPSVATKDLVDYVYDVFQDNGKTLRIIAIAKSAQRNNVAKEVVNIKVPTLLIWGLNDTITPPFVAHEFNTLIPGSVLKFVDKCGHAPMMEHPELFNEYLDEFYR